MRSGSSAGQTGFSLIELMAVISIVGVLAAVGIPALLDTIRSAQVRSATSQLYDAFILARSEAVKRGGVEVDVQPGGSCVAPAANNTALWTTGWTVWTLTAAGACDKQLQTFPATNNITIAPSAGGIGYLPTGRLSNSTDTTFTLQSTKSATIPARCIVISASGQASVRVGTSSACG